MEKLIISGGNRLYGSTEIKGAKNSILPLLAAAVLTKDKVTLHGCPDITDITNMLEILQNLGVMTERRGGDISVWGGVKNTEIPTELAKAIRSSIFLLGSLIATTGRARVAYPGGCDIGLRPVDIHLKALRELSITVEEQAGYINCAASQIVGADIQLDKISVGATENIIMAAVLARGETVIRNAAKEPEITDLADMLNKMGAKIRGAGTSLIEINGVAELHGADFTPIPDRIVAGTLMTAAAITGGELEICNVIPEHLSAITAKLLQSACNVRCYCDRILISCNARNRAVDIETSPYPAFPTDMQAQMTSLLAVAQGTGLVIENIFETRFKHVPELKRMGADITVRGDMAIVRGVPSLYGAEVQATDLRGGSALVLAGLRAEGTTIIDCARHIDRGYERLECVLAKLGAKIERTDYE